MASLSSIQSFYLFKYWPVHSEFHPLINTWCEPLPCSLKAILSRFFQPFAFWHPLLWQNKTTCGKKPIRLKCYILSCDFFSRQLKTLAFHYTTLSISSICANCFMPFHSISSLLHHLHLPLSISWPTLKTKWPSAAHSHSGLTQPTTYSLIKNFTADLSWNGVRWEHTQTLHQALHNYMPH